ncbi:hypothetical protein QCA50_000947 [Cerrena zonata]|uniref:Mitochondrial distribution and morphology protein 34 n=1 Tax=Cerrena zonata TaxID=2478898 RepID=A0AAW0GS91_9APHY
MSFTFQWPRFSDQFHADAIKMLDSALNKGNKPPVIADRIEVVELEMGTQPPELEVRDIGELTMDQFRGIFRLTYAGDAHIVLRTKVQANPLNHKQPDIHLLAGSRGMLAAKQPLIVPMLLRLSNFKLNSYVVLVVSKQKGITLVFKTDPLQNVDINSTFDSIAVIQKFIQREIEGQLRQMFREDLPGIIHRLSQQWVKAKVEAPYLNIRPPAITRSQSVASAPDPSMRLPPRMPLPMHPQLMRSQSAASMVGYPARPRSSSGTSVSSVGRRTTTSVASSPSPPDTSLQTSPEGPTSFPHLEHFDPTYGLRPERIPAKSLFSNFRRAFAPNRGLADLVEEASEVDEEEESGSYGNWEDMFSETQSQYSPSIMPPSVSEMADDMTEYESVPAVGGGTITRPRVIHSQSQIDLGEGSISPRASTSRPMSSLSRSLSALPGATPMLVQTPGFMTPYEPGPSRASHYNPYFAGATPFYDRSRSYVDLSEEIDDYPRRPSVYPIPPIPSLDIPSSSRRPSSPASVRSQPSRSTDMTHSVPTPPQIDSDDDAGIRIPRSRRPSLSSFHTIDKFYTGSPPDSFISDHDPKIILKPAVNNSVSRLSTLSHSNHTLSPYTRTLEHFTVRSVPPRESTSSGSGSAADRQPVKAKRKRVYRLGGKQKEKAPEVRHERDDMDSLASEPHSPMPGGSEFDVEDMDRYFRSRDDIVPQYPDLHPSHVRRRSSHWS